MPYLIIVKKAPGMEATETPTKEVAGATLRIGRGTDNDLCLEDSAVQLHHAVIQEIGGAYVLRDLGDGSLTSVNDKPAKEAILYAKGTIGIGPYLLRFARPTPKSPLTIEYACRTGTGSTVEDETTVETMVLPVSPLAVASVPVDPDTTHVPQPTAVPDPPTTAKKPGETSADPDATQPLKPISGTPPA